MCARVYFRGITEEQSLRFLKPLQDILSVNRGRFEVHFAWQA